MTAMPHLAAMDWDYADRLQHTQKGAGSGGQHTYFTYDGGGQRVRKVAVAGGSVKERIYLGGYEIYRERADAPGASTDFERQTLHLMDDQRRVAMVETKTLEGAATPTPIVSRRRFQLENHLGSATLELDDAGGVISYEEYHPCGSSAFRASSGSAEVSAKRYRYTGKEKDEETGLYYHGARYYAPWLGRWTAADPMAIREPAHADPNPYEAMANAPTHAVDPNGEQSVFLTRRQAVTPRSPAEVKANDRASASKQPAEPHATKSPERSSKPQEQSKLDVTQAERLLKYVESEKFDPSKLVSLDKKGRGFSAEQIRNILRVCLRAYIGLEKRGAVGANAAFVAAQLGETGFGIAGPNAKILNWFSVQPSYPGTTNKAMIARREAFIARGAQISSGARAETNRSSPRVDNPDFSRLGKQRGLDVMVEAQLELVYGLPSPSGDSSKKIAMFPGLGAALMNKDLTASQFAAAAQRGYGPLYAKEFPGWYSSVRSLLARALEPAAAGLDADAASWGKAMAASLPAIR